MKLLSRLCLLTCLIYLQSCGDGLIKHKNGDTKKAVTIAHSKIPVPDATDNLIIKDEKDLVGYWVGNFYSAFEGPVNISIDEIDGNKISGHTLIGGIYKPFDTEMEKTSSSYNFLAKRAGTGKYDGKLKINIAEGDSILRCTWMPYGGTKTHESVHGFSKKFFTYNPHNKLNQGRFVDYKKERSVKYHDADGEIDEAEYLAATPDVSKYNASTDLLTKDEVSNMKKPDILVLRNSIFARHGYAFKKEALWVYFGSQDWYIPVNTDVTTELTPLEKKNIELLMRYEKNAKDYYDTFGR